MKLDLSLGIISRVSPLCVPMLGLTKHHRASGFGCLSIPKALTWLSSFGCLGFSQNLRLLDSLFSSIEAPAFGSQLLSLAWGLTLEAAPRQGRRSSWHYLSCERYGSLWWWKRRILIPTLVRGTRLLHVLVRWQSSGRAMRSMGSKIILKLDVLWLSEWACEAPPFGWFGAFGGALGPEVISGAPYTGSVVSTPLERQWSLGQRSPGFPVPVLVV